MRSDMPSKARRLNVLTLDVIQIRTDGWVASEFSGVRIQVDGVDLLDLIFEFEKPFMMAQGRSSIEQRRTSPASSDLTKRILKGYRYYYDAWSPVLDCECRCVGCLPLDAKIVLTRSVVKWKAF